MELLLPIVSILGLYWFSVSFFLAKRQLALTAKCDEGPELMKDILGLSPLEVERIFSAHDPQKGCWLDRRIDSLVILVVDALRFDFARYGLPLSIGARIGDEEGTELFRRTHSHTSKRTNRTTSSQLLQFVADPPTVTMQRLKGLTTGSLPTFADISGNFGGSSIDEDSWVQQLKDTPYERRGLQFPSRLGFVGDDTWVDLFPTQFEESFPYPSFNTRDLDTVDNGCLKELPRLLNHLRRSGETEDELEVIVSHFLGVDHVGHTYGPNDEHMAQKLNQMDAALSTTLELIDESSKCHLVLIFGDHGMTEDGNHGGGSDYEINAALFVHFSPACGDMPVDLAPQMGSKYIQEAFQSIHQIDLVPTISILLGLPIPYANLGGIAPTLLGSVGIQETTAALALNAAQVWRYFSIYSSTANKLPRLPELKERLDEAIHIYKEALSHPEAIDSNAYYKASGLFKVFLVEAAELGHQVWTRFDTVGMILGGSVVFLALIVQASAMYLAALVVRLPPVNHWFEMGMTASFIIFHSGVLSFGNSYIEAEQSILMFMMGMMGFAIFLRMRHSKAGGHAAIVPYIPLLLPILSRLSEVVVSGHGLDPSLRIHAAHDVLVFLPSLMGLLILRFYWWHRASEKPTHGLFSFGFFHWVVDATTILFVARSWVDKRSLDHDENGNGYFWMRLAIMAVLCSTPITIYPLFESSTKSNLRTDSTETLSPGLTFMAKILILIMIVTGPATAATVLIACLQGWMLFLLCSATGFYAVSSMMSTLC